MIYLRRVVGDSMLPTLKPGQIIIGLKLPLKKGSVVIAEDNYMQVVKRLVDIDSSHVYLMGDNRTESRNLKLQKHHVLARVIWPII